MKLWGERGEGIVHKVENQSTLWKLFDRLIKAYEARTEVLKGTPPLGETSVAQKLDAIINMLLPLAPVPGDLGFAREELKMIHGLLVNPQPNPLEVKFMFIVKDDEADKTFGVVTGNVTDAEGNVIPEASVELAVASTDESVVAVTFDSSTKTGSVHFGNPGTATITATASSGGKLLGSGAADFTVTVGDPAAISGVALNFDGLTEV